MAFLTLPRRVLASVEEAFSNVCLKFFSEFSVSCSVWTFCDQFMYDLEEGRRKKLYSDYSSETSSVVVSSYDST